VLKCPARHIHPIVPDLRESYSIEIRDRRASGHSQSSGLIGAVEVGMPEIRFVSIRVFPASAGRIRIRSAMAMDRTVRDFHRDLSDPLVILLVLARSHRTIVVSDGHIEQ
jgi:hypothetical protein